MEEAGLTYLIGLVILSAAIGCHINATAIGFVVFGIGLIAGALVGAFINFWKSCK